MPSIKRITLISEADYQSVYGVPSFSVDDRRIFFSFVEQEKALIDSLKTTKGKIFFILQLGIFRKKNLFFSIKKGDYQFELAYIRKTYFPKSKRNFSPPSIQSLKNHRRMILGLLGYRKSGPCDRAKAEKICLELVRISVNREFLFKKIKEHFDIHKILIPSYSFFCKIISKSLVKEQRRLNSVTRRHLKDFSSSEMDHFLEIDLALLKSEPKDFSLKEIKKEIDKVTILNELFPKIEKIASDLKISNEGFKYYASLIDYYQIHRLKKMSKEKVTLYLCCYIYIKIQKVNDNLINSFIYHVANFSSLAKDCAKEDIYRNKEENRSALKHLPDVLRIILDDSNGEKKLYDIQKSIYRFVPRNDLLDLTKFLSERKIDIYQYEWNYIQKIYLKFIKYLRPIIKSINFESNIKGNMGLEAISFLKNTLLKGKKLEKNIPEKSIPTHLRRYLFENGKIIPSCYEFLIYKILKNGIESGDIYVDKSIHYKCFEKDLISDSDWNQRKIIIKKSDLAILRMPIEKTVEALEEELHTRINDVNNRLKNEENPYVKILKKKETIKWSLKYEPNKEESDLSLFSDCTQIGISDLLRYVNFECNFTKVFNHLLKTETNTPNKEAILACIISYGTNLGLYRMSQISNLTYRELIDTAQNFIREDILKKANDLIADEISKLPTFEYFNLEDGTIHSSSDGQKFEVQYDSINTRYSSKYFGLGKGISCYTLIANHIPINAKIIGANEYEGHHVFDLIYNNSTQIKPKTHSTDTHGANQVNFALLDFFGYQFAPRYKKFANKKIYSFHPLHYYSQSLIKPRKTINKKLIISELRKI